MSSYKIIKGASVPEQMLQVLPLRRNNMEGGNSCQGGRSRETRDVLANFQAWAVAQAEETISRARVTAEEIIRQAQVESEKLKHQAYHKALEQGFREGSEKGYREAISEAQEEASAIRIQAQDVLKQTEQIRRRTLESLEQEVIDLAREISERLLTAHLALEPDAVLKVAAESLSLVTDRRNLVLYVNPAEEELVKSKMHTLLTMLPAGATINVLSDSSISKGGCIIETDQGRVDATMENRKKELINVLYGRD